MTVNDETSKKAPTPDTQSVDKETLTRATILPEKLKTHARKTWQGVWTVVGALATIGGVIGLYQFMATPHTQQGPSTETLLVAMVAEGVISDEQAGNLSKMLTEPSRVVGYDNGDAVKSAIERQDKDTLIAMAKTYDEDSRDEGLDMLEAEAETSKDWLLIAQLSIGQDNQRSLSAAEKSVQLDRDNFRALTLLVQAQMVAGDYDRARRSAESARILARTPFERLMSEQAALQISVKGANKPQIKTDLDRLAKAIQAYQPVLDGADFDRDLTKDTLDSHPNWVMGFIKQIESNAFSALEKFDDARISSKESTAFFQALDPIAPGDLQQYVLGREISNMRSVADSYAEEEDYASATKVYRDLIIKLEDLVAEGLDNGEHELAQTIGAAAWVAHQDDNLGLELEYYQRCFEIYEKLLAKDPDSEHLKESLDWARKMIESTRATMAGDGTEMRTFQQAYQQAKDRLTKAPLDTDIQKKYKREFINMSLLYSNDWERYGADFDVLLGDSRALLKRLETQNGPQFFTYEMQYNMALYSGISEKDQGNIQSARAQFGNMLHFADLLAAAPDIEAFDIDERGFRVESFKLSAYYQMSKLDDERALDDSWTGLRLAEAWDSAGQLMTNEQFLIQHFKDRIAELEAEK